MAIREYQCKTCGIFEQFVQKTLSSTKCPQCGKSAELVPFSLPAKRNPRYGIQS